MQLITVCTGPHCKARGGGGTLAEIFRRLPGNHEVLTQVCMHSCAYGPNLKVGKSPRRGVPITEDACRKILTEAAST